MYTAIQGSVEVFDEEAAGAGRRVSLSFQGRRLLRHLCDVAGRKIHFRWEGESMSDRSRLSWLGRAGFVQTDCSTLRNEVESLAINRASAQAPQLAVYWSSRGFLNDQPTEAQLVTVFPPPVLLIPICAFGILNNILSCTCIFRHGL